MAEEKGGGFTDPSVQDGSTGFARSGRRPPTPEKRTER